MLFRSRNTQDLEMSTESITGQYPLFGSSLLNLVNTAEKAIPFPEKEK